MPFFTFSKRAAATVPCEASLLYEILTDYDTYSEWMPFIVKSKLLAKEGDLAIAEFELSQPKDDKFDMEAIHTKNKMVLCRAIGGKTPIAQFRWDIVPSSEGQSQVTLTMEAKAHWKRFVPTYSRFMSPAICLQALALHASIFLPEMVLADEEGEKILEVSETPEGLVCWLRGKKYILSPAPDAS
jgi:ribosome-associated toxin RatA of RatAB toxin-antitoxin module